ncbi:MAG: thioredoxin family protein [Phycisphaerales bacterium]
MALTPSTMLPVGTPAPDFALPDFDGNTVVLADFADRAGLLVVFMCNHCPYVIHLQDELARVARECQDRNIGVVAINANDIAKHPDDAPIKMKRRAEEVGFTFPYLYDSSQEVAQAYRAACTPDFFLFDRAKKLFYRGQFDETRPSSGQNPTGADLRRAVEALLAGQAPPETQIPSAGCNIKWKPGNEPDYARSG